jgi:natural product precursor
MKKKVGNRLQLNKSTITHLKQSDMQQVKGGGSRNHWTCSSVPCGSAISCVSFQVCPVDTTNGGTTIAAQ